MSANVTRREHPTNTTEQIHEYLTGAEEILRIQGYSPKEHPLLLCEVLKLVSQKQITFEAATPVAVDLAALRNGPAGR